MPRMESKCKLRSKLTVSLKAAFYHFHFCYFQSRGRTTPGNRKDVNLVLLEFSSVRLKSSGPWIACPKAPPSSMQYKPMTGDPVPRTLRHVSTCFTNIPSKRLLWARCWIRSAVKLRPNGPRGAGEFAGKVDSTCSTTRGVGLVEERP